MVQKREILTHANYKFQGLRFLEVVDKSGIMPGVLALRAVQPSSFSASFEPGFATRSHSRPAAGTEEVPEGCVAVLSANGQCPDLLSHSAVRARNMDVLLAACFSQEVRGILCDVRMSCTHVCYHRALPQWSFCRSGHSATVVILPQWSFCHGGHSARHVSHANGHK